MKRIVGRREKIHLKEWGLESISAKIDTGAYTSSVHCKYAVVKEKNGEKWLEFIVLDPDHPFYNGMIIRTVDFERKKVTNSSGQTETRYKVKTKVTMFGEEMEGEFTLSDRSKMKTAILLGRKILFGRFLVDVEEVNLSRKFNKLKK